MIAIANLILLKRIKKAMSETPLKAIKKYDKYFKPSDFFQLSASETPLTES